MKKTFILFTVIALVISLPVVIEYASGNIELGAPVGETVYSSPQISDTKKMNLVGVNLAEYNYVEVYQYSIVSSNTLYVLGRTKTNEIHLSSINIEKKEQISIVRYPIYGNFPISNVRFLILSMQRLKSTDLFIILTYRDNFSGMQVELTKTKIEIFKFQMKNKYDLINQVEIEESNISLFPHPGSKDEYLNYAYNYMPEDVGKFRPATKVISKIFLCDANGDGYTDILVWKKILLSRLLKDTNKDDFVFDREELSAMYFDKEKMTFSQLTPIK